MLEPTFGEFAGLPALERLAAEAGSWPEAVEDWQWCARFAYQVIERRGTGGGCLPADVLALPRGGGTRRGAAGGRGGRALDRAGRGVPSGERERRAGAGALARGRRGRRRVAEAERRLWTALAGS